MGNFSLWDFVAAVGLAFFIEGVIFLAFPEGTKKMLATVSVSPTAQLRIAGLISAVIGLAVVWFARA